MMCNLPAPTSISLSPETLELFNVAFSRGRLAVLASAIGCGLVDKKTAVVLLDSFSGCEYPIRGVLDLTKGVYHNSDSSGRCSSLSFGRAAVFF